MSITIKSLGLQTWETTWWPQLGVGLQEGQRLKMDFPRERKDDQGLRAWPQLSRQWLSETRQIKQLGPQKKVKRTSKPKWGVSIGPLATKDSLVLVDAESQRPEANQSTSSVPGVHFTGRGLVPGPAVSSVRRADPRPGRGNARETRSFSPGFGEWLKTTWLGAQNLRGGKTDRARSNTTVAVDKERKSPHRWNGRCSRLLHNYFRYVTSPWDTFPKFFKGRNFLPNVLYAVPSHLHSSGCTVGVRSVIKTLSGHGKILQGRKERRKILLFVHDGNLVLFPKSVTKNENS